MPNAEPSPRLTASQKKALSALLAANRELTNTELRERAGGDLKKEYRVSLFEQGLIQVRKAGQTFALELTGAGRRVARGLIDFVPIKPDQPAESLPESGLTPSQVLALVVLMAEARGLSNDELKELAGFALTGRDNTELERQGLVETDRSQRPFSHQLTDKGWRMVRELHTTRPPQAGGSAIRSLFTVLANVHRALDRLQVSHAEFFQQAAMVRPVPTHTATATDSGNVAALIRSVYHELARVPGDWVGLADVRDRLGDLDRAIVDAALHSLRRQDGVRVIPVANTKALRARDRAAALRIGDTDAHALAIGQP